MSAEYRVEVRAIENAETGKFRPEIVVGEPAKEEANEEVVIYQGHRPRSGVEFDTRKEALDYGLSHVRQLMSDKYGPNAKYLLVESVFISRPALDIVTGSLTATDRILGYLGRFDPKPHGKKE